MTATICLTYYKYSLEQFLTNKSDICLKSVDSLLLVSDGISQQRRTCSNFSLSAKEFRMKKNSIPGLYLVLTNLLGCVGVVCSDTVVASGPWWNQGVGCLLRHSSIKIITTKKDNLDFQNRISKRSIPDLHQESRPDKREHGRILIVGAVLRTVRAVKKGARGHTIQL